MLPTPNQFSGYRPESRHVSRSSSFNEYNSKTIVLENDGEIPEVTMEDDFSDESAYDPEDPTVSILDIDYNLNKENDEIIKLNEICAKMTKGSILDSDITLREMGDRDYRFIFPTVPAVTNCNSHETSIEEKLKMHRLLSEKKEDPVQEINGNGENTESVANSENAENTEGNENVSSYDLFNKSLNHQSLKIDKVDDLEYEDLITMYNSIKEELTLLSCEQDEPIDFSVKRDCEQDEPKDYSVKRDGTADMPIELDDISSDENASEEANKLSIVLENDVLPEEENPNVPSLNALEEEENILREQLIRKMLEKRSMIGDTNSSDSGVIEMDSPTTSKSVAKAESSSVLNNKNNSGSVNTQLELPKPKIDFSRYRLVIQISGGEDSEDEDDDLNELSIRPQINNSLLSGKPSRSNVIQKLSTSQQEEYQKLKQEIERRELKTVSNENLQKFESKLKESMKKRHQKSQKVGVLKRSIVNTRKELKKSNAQVRQLQKMLEAANKKVQLYTVKLKIDSKELSETQSLLKDEVQIGKHYKKMCLDMGQALRGRTYNIPSIAPMPPHVDRQQKRTKSFNEVVKNNIAKNSDKKVETASRFVRGKVNSFLKYSKNYKPVLLFEHYVNFNFTLFQCSNFYKSSQSSIQFNEFSEKRSDVLNVNLNQFPQINSTTDLTTDNYSSVLQHFNSYRFALNQQGDISTNNWSNGLDPNMIICNYELFGVCNDADCKYQHTKDYLYGPQEKMMDVLTYVPELDESLNLSQFRNDPQELRKVLSNFVQSKLGHSGKKSIESVCREISNDIRNQSKTSVSSFLIRSIPKELVNFGDNKAPASAHVAFDEYLYRFNLKDETFQMKLSKLWDMQTNNDPDLYLRNRFFAPEGIPISAQLEASLATDPHNTQMWINLAYCYLKRFRDGQYDINFCIDSSLNVLSRALDANRDNAELYEQYLQFYSNKLDLIAANGKLSSRDIVPIDEICRRILKFCSTYRLWVCYLNLCDKLSHKERVVSTILEQFCSSKIKYASEETRSLNILEIIMYRINLSLQLNKFEDAVKFFYDIFTQKASTSTSSESQSNSLTNLSLLITKEHRVFAWICYIHLVLFRCLPYHCFQLSKKSCFLYLNDVRPFVIHWKNISLDNDLQHISQCEMLLNRAIKNCCATAEIDDSIAANSCNQSKCQNSCFALRFNLAQLSKVIQSANQSESSSAEVTNSYSYLSTVYSDNFVALSHLHILQLFEIELNKEGSNESIVLVLMQNFYNAYNQNALRSFVEWNDQMLEALKHQVQFDYWLAFYHYKCGNFSKCKEILTQSLLYFYSDTQICDLNDNLLQQLFEFILFEDFTFDSTVQFEQEAIRYGLKFGRDKRASKLVYLYLSYM